jgi:hypothetical protein
MKQWLKEHPQTQLTAWTIEKVLWGDKFKTITFFTDEFRYSAKFQTPDEYQAHVNMLMDEFPMQGNTIIGNLYLYFDPESGAINIDFKPLQSEEQYYVWRQFDWGLVCDLGDTTVWQKPKPKGTKAKNPSAKQKPVS